MHNLPRICLTHELEADSAIHDTLQTEPDGFDARFSVAFACKEAAEHGDQSQDLVESWEVSGWFLLVKEVGGMPFIFVEEQDGGQFGAGSAESHQHSNPPGDHEVQCDGTLQTSDGSQLQSLNAAAVLEDVEEDLDFPACAIPVNQFRHLFERLGGAIGQQAPLDRATAGRWIDLLGHHTGGPDCLVVAMMRIPHQTACLLAHSGRSGEESHRRSRMTAYG